MSVKVALTVLGGVHDGRCIPLHSTEFVIGREEGCHLRPVSMEVSRRHCAIIQRAGKVYLRDFGSRNGTILNGRVPVRGEVELVDGDCLQVGPLAFRVRIDQAGAAGVPPSPQAGRTMVPVLSSPVDCEFVANESARADSPEDTVLVSSASELLVKPMPPGDAAEMLCSDEN
ncbi:MAG: hypothetical protein C4297_08995 [Gemmataceae bacterium]